MTNDLEVEREFEVNSQPSSSSSNSLHILQLINTCIPLLNHEQNIQEIEENITKLPLNEIIIRDSAVNEFIQALENFQNRSDIQINAKLRRRAKRLIESLMKLQSNEVQSATTEANINEENIVVTIVAKVPLSKTLELLKSVHSFHEMEYALNSMELPDFQTINKDQSEGIPCY